MSKTEKAEMGLAMVLLNEPAMCDAQTFCRSIQKALPDLPVAMTDGEPEKDIVVLRIGEALLYLALMPGPVPWSDLESLTKNAWHWEESGDLLRGHKAHILVSLMNATDDPIENAMRLSQVTAGVLAAQDCLGVYWGGPAISPRELFLESVQDAAAGGPYPLLSWVSFALVPEPAGLSMVSQGMDKLGHKEMEVLADSGDESIVDYALTMCDYVLKKGPVLLHGQTIGRTAKEQFPITHRPWRWDASKGAIVIDMRKNSGKRKGFFGRLFGK